MASDDHNAAAAYSDSDGEDRDRYLMVPVPSSNSAVIRYVPDTKRPPPPPPPPLFQRLWTDEDEIELLRGFLDYTTRCGWLNSSHHHDTSAFYAEIKPKLNLHFNKSQLVEKLRRLKKKYRTVSAKLAADNGQNFRFKTAHDEATFCISHKIWNFAVSNFSPGMEYTMEIPAANPNLIECNSNKDTDCEIGPRKRLRKPDEQTGDTVTVTPVSVDYCSSMSSLIEETVKLCATPVIKELVRKMRSAHSEGVDEVAGFGFGGMMTLNQVPLSFSGGSGGYDELDEKWRKQQILELEVFSKRIELVQDQIKSTLKEVRSKGC